MTTDTKQTAKDRALADLPEFEIELVKANVEWVDASAEAEASLDALKATQERRRKARERLAAAGPELDRLEKLVGLLRKTAGVKAEVSGSEEDEA